MTQIVTSHYPIALGTLPSSWASTTVGEVNFDIQPGFASGVHNQEGVGIPHLRPMNIDREGKLDLRVIKYVSASKPLRLQIGDVLFNNTNSAELVGKTAYIGIEAELAFSNHMTRLRPVTGVDPRFLAYQLHFLWMTGYFQHRCTHHVNQASVSSTALAESVPFVLAPVSEQLRIIEEVEKQLTRLDAAVAALKTVQANLKRYRASVLKAACEGLLLPGEAEVARREGRPYEPASVFLARLQREHINLKAVQRELVDSHQLPTNKLPEVPEGWVWTTLNELLISIEAGKSFKCEERPPNHNETGVVKVSAVTWGEFDEKESKTCVEPARINEHYIIARGDFLFSRANTIQLVGACVIVKNIKSRLMLSDKILRFKLVSIPKEWILYFLRSQFGRSEIERLSTGNQESMRNIGQERIRSIRIALPPLAEVQNITIDLERRLSIVAEIESQTEVGLRRAARLRQSILKAAFEGKLVAQDPNDEPASELLKRIKSIVESVRVSRSDKLETRGERLAMSRDRKTKRRPIVEVLQKARAGMSPEALFVAAGYESESVDEFFIELKAQFEAGTLLEKRVGDKVTLRVK